MEPGDKKFNIDLGLATRSSASDWIYITAKRIDDTHQIKWAMKKEINISHYELERRLGDKDEFVPLTLKIEANNQSNNTHEYEVIDHSIQKSGKYYYRVKQVDKSGKFIYSNRVTVVFVDDSNLSIIPSLAVNETRVEIDLAVSSKVTLQLMDMTTSMVTTIRDQVFPEGRHIIPVDLTGLVSGVYHVVAEIDGTKVSKKLIKLK
jgi:hypothetical protein